MISCIYWWFVSAGTTEKQKKYFPDKEDEEKPCFTLATMMRQLFNVIERYFWPDGTGTKN